MLDINLIREDPEQVRQSLRVRQMDSGVVDQVLEQDARWRQMLVEVEELKAQRNTVSREIGRMKEPAERQAKIDAMRQVGDRIAVLDEQVRAGRSRSAGSDGAPAGPPYG
jgi:seryl-tRNA synthetase